MLSSARPFRSLFHVARAAALATCAALPLACSDAPDGAAFVDLSALPVEALGESAPEYAVQGGWLTHTQTLEPGEWTPGPLPNIRQVSLVVAGNAESADPQVPHRLEPREPGTSFTPVPFTHNLIKEDGFEPGMFTVVGRHLFLCDPTGALSAEPLVYTASFPGVEHGRFTLGGITASGWLLTQGQGVAVQVPPLAGPADLSFGVWAYGSPELAGAMTYAVELDGEEIFREVLPADVVGELRTRSVELGTGGGGELRLRVEGGGGLLAVGAPRLVTRAYLEEQERGDGRPDLVLFVADTFRADNLALHGGDPRWTPTLNAWAEEGLAFERAAATAAWTLPSQASMFAGVYPYQHGAVASSLRLPDELTTLTEQLRDAGYRTIAVTDGIYLTQRFGLAQGFETFVQFSPTKDFAGSTLRALESLLAADDGRPVFLYVQTYYTHTPYEVSEATRAAFPQLFPADAPAEHRDWLLLQEHMKAELAQWLRGELGDADLEPSRRALEALYRGGVHDFDQWFGEVLALFERHGLDDAYVLLTSDHGEAFGEHETLYHGDSVHEEEVHVPLVLRGPDIEPSVHREPVSLIDLAPTFAHLADVPVAPAWVGESLLAEDRAARPFGTFTNSPRDRHLARPFALYDGTRKVFGSAVSEELTEWPTAGYDLATDPGETAPVGPDAWPGTVGTAWRAEVEAWLRPLGPVRSLELSETERSNLEAMGYMGDD